MTITQKTSGYKNNINTTDVYPSPYIYPFTTVTISSFFCLVQLGYSITDEAMGDGVVIAHYRVIVIK